METQQRTCRTCGKEQPLTEYYKTGRKNDKNPDERHHECKACTKERVSAAHKANPDLQRNRDLKRLYNITLEEYAERLKQQDGKCAACGTSNPGGRHNTFVVDHSHTTGAVRGLLCHNCNTALGLLKDNADTLANLITYLAK